MRGVDGVVGAVAVTKVLVGVVKDQPGPSGLAGIANPLQRLLRHDGASGVARVGDYDHLDAGVVRKPALDPARVRGEGAGVAVAVDDRGPKAGHLERHHMVEI